MPSIRPLTLVLLLCAACAAEDPGPRGHASNPIAGAGQGGAGGISGVGGNGAGGTAGSMAGAGASGGGPILDPDAPPFVRDDSAGAGLDPATLDALQNATGGCAVTLLYPYDRTVFPGGLPSPRLRWKESIDAVYVHASYEGSDAVDYRFAAQGGGPVSLPQDAWNEITRRTRNSLLVLTLGVESGGNVSACETRWRIAPGNMTGAVYYNTYNAPSPDGTPYGGGNAGAVMRLTLGQESAEVYLRYTGMSMPGTGPCTACHSLSFNGSTMVASTHNYMLFFQKFEVYSYPLTPTLQPPSISLLDNGAFGALTPDGKRLLTMGNPDCTAGADTFPRSPNNFPLVEGPDTARIQDTATGQTVDSVGLDPDHYMWMPQFSPDGKHVVFNHAKPNGAGGTDRRELAMMDYDYSSNTFSNLQVLVSHLGPEPTLPYQPMSAGAGPIPAGRNGCTGAQSLLGNTGNLDPGTCEGPCYPAYPFFTPDSRAVIFSMTSEPDFANSFPGRTNPAKADLWYVDVETKQTVRLDAANDSHDPQKTLIDFYPTVMPIQVGGYFWLFWTSRRDFEMSSPYAGGNMYYTPPPEDPNGMPDPNRKRIWVSAISPKNDAGDVMAAALADPSHPGFYLPGQSETGNIRAFATLNPCRASGDSCVSGLDCCDGFCAGGLCTEVKPMCSTTNEKCAVDADCCAPTAPDVPTNTCIGGFCGFVTARAPD